MSTVKKKPDLSFETVRDPNECLIENIRALIVGDAVLTPLAIYQSMLRESVFKRPVREIGDRKLVARYQKKLRQADAYAVLRSIWKESPSITDRELSRAGYSRVFGNKPIGSLTLAKSLVRKASAETGKLQEDESDQDKDERAERRVTERVRSIALAAEAYGLIERHGITRTSIDLVGTERLHGFMVAYAKAIVELFRTFAELAEQTANDPIDR